jgi:hypothetical protein
MIRTSEAYLFVLKLEVSSIGVSHSNARSLVLPEWLYVVTAPAAATRKYATSG